MQFKGTYEIKSHKIRSDQMHWIAYSSFYVPAQKRQGWLAVRTPSFGTVLA